jgi:hypothetical protein
MGEAVDDTIYSEVHEKRYMLAEEAPIGSGKLFEDFGYVANTLVSKAVLDGTYQPPPDSDAVIKKLFTKIAAIRKVISKDSVSLLITPGQWKQY